MPRPTATATDSVANERLEARVTAHQKALFREAAELQGVTLTDFVVSSVHQAAVRALEARHLLDLSRRDQQAFVRALLGRLRPTRGCAGPGPGTRGLKADQWRAPRVAGLAAVVADERVPFSSNFRAQA